MLASLVNQALKERRWTYLALFLGLILYLALALGFLPFIPIDQEKAWLSRIDRALFWGDTTPYSETVAWLNLAGFGLGLPVILSVFAIFHIKDWIFANRGGSQLALLLSYPITRWQLFAVSFAIQAVFLFFLALTSAAVIIIGVSVFQVEISAVRILSLSAILAVFSLFFCFTAFVAGNLSGKAWVAAAAGAGLLILGYIIYLLPGLTNLPSWIRWFSPLAVYLEGNPLASGLRAVNWLGTAGWTAAACAAAWLHFERLDLGN